MQQKTEISLRLISFIINYRTYTKNWHFSDKICDVTSVKSPLNNKLDKKRAKTHQKHSVVAGQVSQWMLIYLFD